MVYLSNPLTWVVAFTTLLIVTLCIGLHYEILSHSRQYLKKISHRRRQRVVVLILIIVVAHTAEIWLFALGYKILLDGLGAGELVGSGVQSIADYVYYSAVVFTTVGFGDLSPVGPIRFMTGMEALVGLVMITWSASYTFLEMQLDWRNG
jgi:hypothetical protein